MFGSFFLSMHTLFQVVSGGIDWREMSNPLIEIHWTHALVLLCYIFFTTFAVTNIITGIFVDASIQNAQRDRDEVIQASLTNRKSMIHELQNFFQDADVDGSGQLTLEEFISHVQDQRVRAYLGALGLEVHEAHGLFCLLDMDDDQAISIEEFIHGCMRLQGN